MAKQGVMVGSRAPDFHMACTQGPGTTRPVGLADFQDRWLALIFYPRDFSLVCPTELTAISSRLAEFQSRECDVLGVSTDSVETHERWIATPREQQGLGGLNFPLASDEGGQVCQAYGVHVARQNVALRGLFLIDPNGVLQYQAVHSLSVGRSTEEVLRVLDALQTGGLCPGDWSPDKPTVQADQTLGPNSVFGPFHIEAVVGTGAFGTVFRARDTLLERTVALKVLRSDGATPAAALLSEARAAAALNHTNLCAVYAVDVTQSVPMIVMEYIAGRPLSAMVKQPLPLDRARALGRQIAQGMAAAHAQGVVHGDLKPANVLVTEDGVAKVTDFGLARRTVPVKADETAVWEPVEAGGISGTPSYMAPEQARGLRAVPASDVFALGLILYEMATGRSAVGDGPLLQVLRRIDEIDAERLASETPEPFATVLRQVLIADPSRRTIRMADVAHRLG